MRHSVVIEEPSVRDTSVRETSSLKLIDGFESVSSQWRKFNVSVIVVNRAQERSGNSLLLDVQHVEAADHKSLRTWRKLSSLNQVLLCLVCLRRNDTDGADKNVDSSFFKSFDNGICIIVVYLQVVHSPLRGTLLPMEH